MYIEIETGQYPLSQGDIEQRFQATMSFPTPFVPPDGFAKVVEVAPPEVDRLTHRLVELAPTVIDGEYVQQWEVVELPQEERLAAQESAARLAREAAKIVRQGLVDAIKVTTSAGHTFDGDEQSQTRMARAILALERTGSASVSWVLADNTVIQATAEELTEALALAGAAQASVWVLE